MTGEHDFTRKVYQQTGQVSAALLSQFPLNENHVLVVGVSTSEVRGQRIGTGGSTEVAAAIFQALEEQQARYGFQLAIQCCEHINRVLLVEQTTAVRYGWEEVSVIPAPKAGGAFAAHAYRKFKQPMMVEHIRADAGIDIGGTLIGMHLKHVVVPLRSEHTKVGDAHVVMAKTRPKLIGGPRAVYTLKQKK